MESWVDAAHTLQTRIRQEMHSAVIRDFVGEMRDQNVAKCTLTPPVLVPDHGCTSDPNALRFISKRTDNKGPQQQMFDQAQAHMAERPGTYPAFVARQHTTGKGYEYAQSTWESVFHRLIDPVVDACKMPSQMRQRSVPMNYFELIYSKVPCKMYFDIDASSALVPLDTAEDLARFYSRTVGFLTMVEEFLNLLVTPDLAAHIAKQTGHAPAHSTRIRLQAVPLTANRPPPPTSSPSSDSDAGGRTAKASIHYVITPYYGDKIVLFGKYYHHHQLAALLSELAHFISDTRENRLACPALHQCLWLDPGGAQSAANLLFDTGVYTRNRLFRCWGSEKRGTGRPLHRNKILGTMLGPLHLKHQIMGVHDDSLDAGQDSDTQLWQGVALQDDRLWDLWMFHSSLVTTYPPMLSCAAFLKITHHRANKRKRGDEETEGAEAGERPLSYASQLAALGNSDALDAEPPDELTEAIMLDISSQIPDADQLEFKYSKGGPHCLVFSSRGKFCTIRGGEHSNNHMYYVCWLDTCTFYQRCFNPGCAAKSAPTAYTAAPVAGTDDSTRSSSNYQQTGRGPTFTLNPTLYQQIGAYLQHHGLAFFNLMSENTAAQLPTSSVTQLAHPAKKSHRGLDDSQTISLRQFEEEMRMHYSELLNGPDEDASLSESESSVGE